MYHFVEIVANLVLYRSKFSNMIVEEDIQKLKTFRRYSYRPNLYYSNYFELQLSKVSSLWCLFHYCEADGELSFIGVVHDVEDLKYLVEQAGIIWED